MWLWRYIIWLAWQAIWLNRLECRDTVLFPFEENYIRDIENGVMQPRGEPSIEKETVATALVNGNDLLGPVRTFEKFMSAWNDYH